MDIEFHDWRDIPEDQASAAGCGRGRLQIWTSVMPVDLDCIKEISTCLSRDERDRASRYLTEESQLEFLFGRSVLRHVIGVWLGVEPASLIFGYGPKGKPFLQFPSVAEALQFNLSHSHGRFVIALCEGRSVGVDIERIECEMDWLPVARRYYSSDELGYLLTVPVDQRASAFFRMWTCKEAFLKATGQGLIDHMAGIQVRLHSGLDPELQLSPLVACDHRNWLVRSIPLPQGYVGTLVAEKMVSSAAIQTCRSGTIREIEYK